MSTEKRRETTITVQQKQLQNSPLEVAPTTLQLVLLFSLFEVCSLSRSQNCQLYLELLAEKKYLSMRLSTLNYDSDLRTASRLVKVTRHAKYLGQRSFCLSVLWRHTDRHTTRLQYLNYEIIGNKPN